MRVALAGIMIAALAACTPTQEKESGQAEVRELDSLAMQVKTELINQEPMAAAAVQVKQRDGKLYLTGFADSEAKKQQLEQIARQAGGGRTVVNQLEIK